MEDSSQMVAHFKRLMRDLQAGSLLRNSFHRWEVDLLLDMQACKLPGPTRRRVLRRYERAVLKGLDRGAAPLKLSEYLDRVHARNHRRCA